MVLISDGLMFALFNCGIIVGGASTSILLSIRTNECSLPSGQKALPLPRKYTSTIVPPNCATLDGGFSNAHLYDIIFGNATPFA